MLAERNAIRWVWWWTTWVITVAASVKTANAEPQLSTGTTLLSEVSS